MIEELRNRNWKVLKNWLGDFSLFDVDSLIDILNQAEHEDQFKMKGFEMILCLIFTEYYNGLQHLLKSDDTIENPRYLQSLKKIHSLLRVVYHEIMMMLND